MQNKENRIPRGVSHCGKIYEKPELKAIKMLEVGAALCCRTSVGTCSSSSRTDKGKGQRTSTSS